MLNPLRWSFVKSNFSKNVVFVVFLFFFVLLQQSEIALNWTINLHKFQVCNNEKGKNNTQKHMKNGQFSIVIFPPSSSSSSFFFFFFIFHYSQIVGFNFNIHKRCVMLMIIEKWFILCKIICYTKGATIAESGKEWESVKKFQWSYNFFFVLRPLSFFCSEHNVTLINQFINLMKQFVILSRNFYAVEEKNGIDFVCMRFFPTQHKQFVSWKAF